MKQGYSPSHSNQESRNKNQPNVLFIMCDQLRADAIAALGNSIVKTPNIDRLVQRGVSFSKAYSSCPVCVPARYNIRTGCEPYSTGVYSNESRSLTGDDSEHMEDRCGPYLARRMAQLGYRTFGIGKFHTRPDWDEDLGYETHLYCEPQYLSKEQREKDNYARFIAEMHPHFEFIEQLHGERTEMYYMPQMSPLPAELTAESWVADRVIEQLLLKDSRPYFGMVSFMGPHPPCAPPIPYNRMYNPDHMFNPVRGEKEMDHMDEQIPWMNHLIWAEDINDSHARVLKARYFGEITYIDQCIGKILDAVEERRDAENTLICFFSDHGDHLGDHRAWQKESFFESSVRIPLLVSWPTKLPQNQVRQDLVNLTDLFGLATTAAGRQELREGKDLLGALENKSASRDYVFGYYGDPGTPRFKMMVRSKDWKYIFMANGGYEQLFNVTEDPQEQELKTDLEPQMLKQMRDTAVHQVQSVPSMKAALLDGKLREFPFESRELKRIYQFDASKGINNFNEK